MNRTTQCSVGEVSGVSGVREVREVSREKEVRKVSGIPCHASRQNGSIQQPIS